LFLHSTPTTTLYPLYNIIKGTHARAKACERKKENIRNANKKRNKKKLFGHITWANSLENNEVLFSIKK